MLFVFDENLPPKLAQGLDLLEKSNPASNVDLDVLSAVEFMGRRGATDEEILEAVGKAGGVVFTKDKDFKQIKLYDKIIEEHKTRVLFFSSNKRFIFFWDMLVAMVGRWEEIKEKLSRDVPPYVYRFDIKNGITELHL
jgi:hypothetical protein